MVSAASAVFGRPRWRTALLLVALAGCAPKSSDVTTIVLDGKTQSFTGKVSCTSQPDGSLLILANGDHGGMVRVLLSREHQLVVEKAGFRINDDHGFTDNSAEMWATKVDDDYTINGRMPPNRGETGERQFTIETRCRNEVPAPPPRLDTGFYG